MEFANNLVLVGAGLVLLSIFAGLVSSRMGAPLLLVFLVLGMLAGEEGPGGIDFDDFGFTYLFGSIALAIILFDGGLRTSYRNFRTAVVPATLLATVGVLVTAIVTGGAAVFLFDLAWVEGLLLGSIVGSTDAAAVFFLLHVGGRRLKERVGPLLEVESGMNDPMAVFLTIACVELVTEGAADVTLDAVETFASLFILQILGGAIAGIAGGLALVALLNRLQLAAGLYPILAVASALAVFALTQKLGGSGFLAVYVAGLIVGNRRHRGMLLINRFHDGLSWLCQIGMFLMLGLLVTPSALVPLLAPAVAIAAILILASRPAAVLLCLAPLGYSLREMAFVSWVGLRGAVPIFLATIPILAEVPQGMAFFAVVYVVVLTSLVVQGWTVTFAARSLDLELPPRPALPMRAEIDLPAGSDKDMAAYSVAPTSIAARRDLARLPLPDGASIVSVIRDGGMQNLETMARLQPGDYVLVIAPDQAMETVDRLFAPSAGRATRSQPMEFVGEFVLDGAVAARTVAEQYGFFVPKAERELPIGMFLARHLRGPLSAGARLRVGDTELVVRKIEGGRVSALSLDLDPEPRMARMLDPLRIRLAAAFTPLLRRLRGSFTRLFARKGAAAGPAGRDGPPGAAREDRGKPRAAPSPGGRDEPAGAPVSDAATRPRSGDSRG